MSDINEDSVGKYFMRDGKLYECISYCSHPTVTFENVKTNERVGGSVGSPNVQGMKELVEKEAI